MKKCVDSFAEKKKKFHIVWIVLEDSSAGHLKIFLDVLLFLFLSWG